MQSVERQQTFRRNIASMLRVEGMPSAFTLVSCSAYSSNLKKDVICPSQTPADCTALYPTSTLQIKIKLKQINIIFILKSIGSRDSSVGIATRLSTGWTTRRGGSSSQKFSLLHIVQTGSGVHPTSYKMGTGGKEAGA
jgi:hypothetical protein